MGCIHRLYKWLTTSPNLAADDALQEALEHVEPEYASALVEAMASRNQPGNWRSMVEQFHALPAEAQQAIVSAAVQRPGELRAVLGTGALQERLNAVEIIRRARQASLADLLVPPLVDAERQVQDGAAGALLELARHTSNAGAADPAQDESRSVAERQEQQRRCRLMAEAIEQALISYPRHRREEIVEAAVLLASHLETVLRRCLAPGAVALAESACALVARQPHPGFVPFVMYAMGLAQCRRPMALVLEEMRDDAFMRALVEHAWWLHDAAVQKGFRAVRRLAWLERGVEPLLALPDRSAGKAVRLVQAVGWPEPQRVWILQNLLFSDRRPFQREALWALTSVGGDRATALLRTVADWDDDELSPIALWELRRREPRVVVAVLVRKLSSGSRRVRSLASEMVGGQSFRDVWARLEQLPARTQRAYLRAIQKITPDFVHRLENKARSPQASEKLQVLHVVRLLELEEQMAETLYRLARDGDAHVRSSAVAALGNVPGPGSVRLILEALRDADPRVRANAVLALQRVEVPQREALLRERLDDPSPRVRANAIVALAADAPEDAEILTRQMLGQPEPWFRVSGLWVAEQTGLPGLVGDVRRVADHDPSPVVRKRAREALARLEAGQQPAEHQPHAPAGGVEQASPSDTAGESL